jgi:hypothetical protein
MTAMMSRSIAARAVLRSLRRGTEHRAAELAFDFDRSAHQDDAPDCVEHDIDPDRPDHDDRQHDQCIQAAARQHAIRQVEEIDRNCQNEHVHNERKYADNDEIVACGAEAFAERVAEIFAARTLLDRRAAATAAAARRDAAAVSPGGRFA